MKIEVLFHQLAEEELNDAAEFYNRECPGLGTIFLDDVEHAISQIKEFPRGCPYIGPSVQRKLLNRFPNGLIFSSCPGGVRILAVMNLKRRPFYWRKRN